MMKEKKEVIRVDPGTLVKLRQLCLDKYGRVYAKMSMEANLAIVNHIRYECEKLKDKNRDLPPD